jgi:hypothetical protein
MVYVVIRGVSEPHLLEMLSWGSQVILVIVAIGTLLYSAWQLKSSASSQAQELRISHANAILEMDRRFESPEMLESREIFMKLREEVLQQVGSGHPKKNDAARAELVRGAWAERLRELRESGDERYMKVMRMCSFFETVGLLVKKEYVRKDDVMLLFKGPIMAIDSSFGGHIEDQLKEMSMPAGLYEHALFLCRDCGE